MTKAESWKKAGGGVLIDCSPIGAGPRDGLMIALTKQANKPVLGKFASGELVASNPPVVSWGSL